MAMVSVLLVCGCRHAISRPRGNDRRMSDVQ